MTINIDNGKLDKECELNRCYSCCGCIPYDGYFVQKLKEGFFIDKWVDIKGFADKEKAEELMEILKS